MEANTSFSSLNILLPDGIVAPRTIDPGLYSESLGMMVRTAEGVGLAASAATASNTPIITTRYYILNIKIKDSHSIYTLYMGMLDYIHTQSIE